MASGYRLLLNRGKLESRMISAFPTIELAEQAAVEFVNGQYDKAEVVSRATGETVGTFTKAEVV